MSRMLNFIDLFCGCGGFSAGLEKAGLNCIAGLDHRQFAIDTFMLNHKSALGICEDIRCSNPDLIRRKIRKHFGSNRKIHLICGGPPCQGFSTVGSGNASDERNHLFLDFLKFVKYFEPEYIMIENVTGLLAKKNREPLKSIYQCFNNLGYNVDIRVLSSNHFGVPEVRRRVIIIGNRIGAKNYFPEKKFANYGENVKNLKKCRDVDWAFKNLITYRGKAHNHNVKEAQIKKKLELKRLKRIPEGKSVRYEKDEKLYLTKSLYFDHGTDEHGNRLTWNDIDENRFREAKLARLDRGRPSPTIVTNKTAHYHPTEHRYLTIREAAAIQSFHPKFKFTGTVSNQWTMIGNAVPPLMAEAIGKAIILSYQNKKFKIKPLNNLDFDQISSYAFKYDKDTQDHALHLQTLFELV